MFAEARGLPAIMGGTKGYCRTAGLKARPALHVLLDVPEVAGVQRRCATRRFGQSTGAPAGLTLQTTAVMSSR